MYFLDKVVATAFLKKTSDEKKLSTLFVKREMRGRGLATTLLDEAFSWLGTTKPVATIAGYKLDQFESIIRHYQWKQTAVLKDHYVLGSDEIVFNANPDLFA